MKYILAILLLVPFAYGAALAQPRISNNSTNTPSETTSDAQSGKKDPAYTPENCGNPTTIACGVPLLSTTTGMGNDVTKYNGNVTGVAGANFSGPDRLFVLTLSQKSNVQIVLDILTTNVDLDILLMSNCNPATVIAASVKNNKTTGTGLRREVLDVNCNAGTWYIMIDGKAANDQGQFNLTADCVCECQELVSSLPNGDKIWADDFGNYIPGRLSHQSTRWSLWSSTGYDAAVAGESILNSNKVAMFTGGISSKPDLIYRTDNATSGRFRLSWRMKMASGKKGYFDVLHTLPNSSGNGAVIAYEVDFATTGKGTVTIDNGLGTKITAAQFEYPLGKWVNVTNLIDIDRDLVELWVADAYVGSWKFSLSSPASATTTQRKTLAGPSFYAKSSEYSFMLDNLCVWQKKSNCLATSVAAPVYTEKGTTYSNMGIAACDLYTGAEMGTFTSTCDAGGPFIDRGETFSGVLESFDEAPTDLKLLGNACNISIGTAAIFAEVYTFFNVKKKSNGQPEEITLNYNSSNGVRCHVFTCQNLLTGVYTGQPTCVGEVKPGQAFTVNPNAHPDIFYYIVFWGPLGSSYNNFSIIPDGFCASGATLLPPDQGNVSGFIGSGTGDPRFTAAGEAYKSCYTGPRTYTGKEVVYKIVVPGSGSLGIKLISRNHPVGAFVYSSICGGSCLAFAENVQNDTVTTGFAATPGVYYVVVDRNNTNGSANFVLQTTFLGVTPNAPTCNARASAPKTHKVIFSPTAYAFRSNDAISVLYDAPDGKLKETESKEIGISGTAFEVKLSDSCDYKPNEQFKIYLSRQNGTIRSFYPMNLTFVPAGVNGNTGGDRFERTRISTIETMTPVTTIPFGSDTRLLSFISTATATQPQFFRLSTGNIAWRSIVTDSPISETPVSAPWLTYTPANQTGPRVISVAVSPYTGAVSRTAYIRFFAESQPHLLAHTVRVEQFGVNGGRSGGDVEMRSMAALEQEASLQTVPNPTAGTATLYLSLPNPAVVTLGVFDLTGRLVQTLQHAAELMGDQSWEMDISSQPNGLYQVVATINGAPLRKTIVLQR